LALTQSWSPLKPKPRRGSAKTKSVSAILGIGPRAEHYSRACRRSFRASKISKSMFCARHRFEVILRTHSALQMFRHHIARKICELLCSPCVWKSSAPVVRLASQRRDPLRRTTRITDPLGNVPKVQHMMHLEPADALSGPSCAFLCYLAPCRKLCTTRGGSPRNAAERRSAALSIRQHQPRAVARRRT
jgi:hypothetical protein